MTVLSQCPAFFMKKKRITHEMLRWIIKGGRNRNVPITEDQEEVEGGYDT